MNRNIIFLIRKFKLTKEQITVYMWLKEQKIKIFEKYVKDSVTGDDLSLTMRIDDFKYSFEKLYQKSKLYK